MSRRFPLRTATTGRRARGGPLYGTAAGSNACVRSAGSLSNLIAPPAAKRCDGDSIPQVEESGAAEFFYFHDWVSGDEAHAGYLPDVRRRMCYIVFKRSIRCIFFP